MDIRQMQYAIALATSLSFRRAAESQHIAQSSFSEQIARLEREVGVRLFERDSHRVALTEAGALFVERAQGMLDDLRATIAEVRDIAGMPETRLRIGLFAEGAGELTPVLMQAFRRAAPSVRLSFCELTMPMQVSALLDTSVDIAIVRPPIGDERLSVHDLFLEPRVAAVSEHHHLSGRDQLHVVDLLEEPMISASFQPWGAFWSCDEERGKPGRPVATVSSVAESLAAVAHLDAVDTFPASAARHYRCPGVRYVPVDDARYASVAIAYCRDEQRDVVHAFARAAVRTAQLSPQLVRDAVLPPSAKLAASC